MSWPFREPLSRRIALVVACAWLAGCTAEETFVTPVQLGNATSDSIKACIGPQGVDVLLVDLIAVNLPASTNQGIAVDCSQCASPDVHCSLMERQCQCVGNRADGNGIADALSGVQFENLDPSQKYCVRLMGLETGTGEGPSQGPGAACSDAASCDPHSGQNVAACILSAVDAVNSSQVPFRLTHYYCTAGNLNGPSGWDRCVAALGMMTCCTEAGKACGGTATIPGISQETACLLTLGQCMGGVELLGSDVSTCSDLPLE